MAHVVLVGGEDINFNSFLSTELYITVIQRRGSVGRKQEAIAKSIIEVDSFEMSTIYPIIAALHASHSIDYLFSFTEEALWTTANTAATLKIPGLDVDACRLSINKNQLRSYLADTPFAIRSRVCASELEALEFFDHVQGNIVVKDPCGSGSKNVFVCTDKAAIAEAFSTIREQGLKSVLVEERLRGREFSVESLSVHGDHHVLGITQKVPYADLLFEKCQIFPAQSLYKRQVESITAYIKALLNSIGLVHGPSHIEIMLSPDDQINLVEINNRIGGDLIWLLVQSVTGVDILRETVLSFIDNTRSLPELSGVHHEVACTRALFGKVDVKQVVANLPMGVNTLHSSFWPSYEVGTQIRQSSDRFGFIAIGFSTKEIFRTAYPLIDDRITELETAENTF